MSRDGEKFMATAADLAVRLNEASIRKSWDPYSTFDWPEVLEPSEHWFMSPELISLYGTDTYEALPEADQKRLSFYELVNLFSFVLLGERLVVEGMMHRTYRKATLGPVTRYLHHFVDEENKHMVMFASFCDRYANGIYPEKKLLAPRELASGAEEIGFFCKVLIVEEIGDVYNVKMMRDDRVHPLVAAINRMHHIDEARHIAFGHEYTREQFARYSRDWSEGDLHSFQDWLSEYLVSAWGDFYNPSVYRDAGVEPGYQTRQMALAHPTCRRMREDVSAKLVDYFLDVGLLRDAPAL